MENHHFGVGNDDKREQFIALPIANGMMKKAIGKWMKGGCVMEAPASSYQSRFSVTVCDKKNILSKHHSEDGCCLPIQGATIAASVWALPNLVDEWGFGCFHESLIAGMDNCGRRATLDVAEVEHCGRRRLSAM